MSNNLTNQEFLYWLKEMRIDYWDASVLLNTTVSRIEKYALGLLPVTPKHSEKCWFLLERRRQELLEDQHFSDDLPASGAALRSVFKARS